MKTTVTLLILLTLFSLPASAQVVEIPDPNLRAAVESALGKASDDTITVDDMATLTTLEASTDFEDPDADTIISDLTGLEHAINLFRLQLRDNSISDISPLSELTNLTELNLDLNSITDISPLAGLDLFRLDLEFNNIEDISPLSGFPHLSVLDLDANNIEDISPLSNLTNLTELDLEFNNIEDISPLSGLTNLRELSLMGNSITDISSLVANTGLGEGDFVGLDENPLNDTSLNTHIPTLRNRGVEVSWVEPTAIEPADPPVDTESSAANSFEMELAKGLTMISLPLMPSHPYTARTFAEMLGATVVIRLDTERKEFVGFTADQSGDGYPIEGGQGYVVNVPAGGTVTFEGTAWNNTIENTAAAPSATLPPSVGWAFVLSGPLRETVAGASYTVVAKNQRTGEVATRQVTSDASDFNVVWADLSRARVIEAGDTLEVILMDEWDNIVSGPFRQRVAIEDLRKAYLSLSLTVGDVHPAETLLGQNFPNPFNPETWIPYQLEKSAAVVLHIYDTPGRVVRTIDLGFKQQGFYMTRSTAAYWDGRNEKGEPVSSGVYFYSLQTPDFSATRKMLILK